MKRAKNDKPKEEDEGKKTAEAAQAYLDKTSPDIDRSVSHADLILQLPYELSPMHYEAAIERLCAIAGKAGANYGKATSEKTREVWLAMVSKLHFIIDDMDENFENNVFAINYNLGRVPGALREFLAKEFQAAAHASAKPVYSTHWKRWAKVTDSLKDSSRHWLDLANQVQGFEQMEMF